MMFWDVNEVPSNLTMFYDVDRDGQWDVAFAHPIMSTQPLKSCSDSDIKPKYDQYIGISSCPDEGSDVPYKMDYIVLKEPSMYRLNDGGDWRTLYLLVEPKKEPMTYEEKHRFVKHKNYYRH